MISKKIEELINDQINFELYSSYIYLSMSSQFKSQGCNGFATWMQVQAQEELCHAMGMYNYLIQRGGRAIMKEIKQPPTEWKSAFAAFKNAYNHETIVTKRINNIASAAEKEKDYATVNFYQWYISEQVEEEANSLEITNQLEMVGSDKNGLFMLDREKGARIFAMPAIPGGGLAAPGGKAA